MRLLLVRLGRELKLTDPLNECSQQQSAQNWMNESILSDLSCQRFEQSYGPAEWTAQAEAQKKPWPLGKEIGKVRKELKRETLQSPFCEPHKWATPKLSCPRKGILMGRDSRISSGAIRIGRDDVGDPTEEKLVPNKARCKQRQAEFQFTSNVTCLSPAPQKSQTRNPQNKQHQPPKTLVTPPYLERIKRASARGAIPRGL